MPDSRSDTNELVVSPWLSHLSSLAYVYNKGAEIRVIKLRPMSWLPVFVNKFCWNTATSVLSRIVYGCSCALQQSWVSTTCKATKFSIWPLRKSLLTHGQTKETLKSIWVLKLSDPKKILLRTLFIKCMKVIYAQVLKKPF